MAAPIMPIASTPSSPASFLLSTTETTEIYTPLYTLSLHDALPIFLHPEFQRSRRTGDERRRDDEEDEEGGDLHAVRALDDIRDRRVQEDQRDQQIGDEGLAL